MASHHHGKEHYWLNRVPAIRFREEQTVPALTPTEPPSPADNAFNVRSVEILWIQGAIISPVIGQYEIDVRVLAAKAGSTV